MKRLYILLALIMIFAGATDVNAQRRKYNRNHSKHRTTRVAKKKGRKAKKKVSTYKPTIHDFQGKLSDPRFLNDSAMRGYVRTCAWYRPESLSGRGVLGDYRREFKNVIRIS